MTEKTKLCIRLSDGRITPTGQVASFDRATGGPLDLLEWLEKQLGLPQMKVERASRVTQYADALAKVENACFSESLIADRWETASELLARRDELMLCGWDGASTQGCPRIVTDLAATEAH